MTPWRNDALAAECIPVKLDDELALALERRRRRGLWRRRARLDSPQGPQVVLDGQVCLSFCSNDYLGLANHPEVVAAFRRAAGDYGVGSGASHLISGHTRAHQALEEELAEFTGRSRALLFSSGYQANVGVLTTLAGKDSRVFEDRLNHASLLDGGLFSGARFRRYPHLDAKRLEAMLAGSDGEGRTLVVSDGVFSMDGDMAPLPELAQACRRHGAVLMLDDAHGLGCLGGEGGGTLAHFRAQGHALDQNDCPVLVGTLGKAFGTAGAFVAGSEALIETLLQFCRPYVYTTALPAALAEATRASLRLLRREGWRRERLGDYVRRFRRHARALGFELMESATPIQAIVLGDVGRTQAASAALRKRGLYVSAIRPPTVPEGSSRLRLTFSAAHTQEQFRALLEGLESLAETAVKPP